LQVTLTLQSIEQQISGLGFTDASPTWDGEYREKKGLPVHWIWFCGSINELAVTRLLHYPEKSMKPGPHSGNDPEPPLTGIVHSVLWGPLGQISLALSKKLSSSDQSP